MAAKGKKVEVPRRDAPSYLAKSAEFQAAAERALGEGQRDAAMLNAIHAAISAADAVTVALAGVRSRDPDHQRAADLLDEVVGGSGDGKTRVTQLRGLLERKNAVEYESRRTRAKEAADSVKRARRIVDWARDIVAG